MRYFIKTFGCQQNVADSKRIASSYETRGIKQATSFEDTNIAIINTCMIRHAPENRIRGLTQKLKKIKDIFNGKIEKELWNISPFRDRSILF